MKLQLAITGAARGSKHSVGTDCGSLVATTDDPNDILRLTFDMDGYEPYYQLRCRYYLPVRVPVVNFLRYSEGEPALVYQQPDVRYGEDAPRVEVELVPHTVMVFGQWIPESDTCPSVMHERAIYPELKFEEVIVEREPWEFLGPPEFGGIGAWETAGDRECRKIQERREREATLLEAERQRVLVEREAAYRNSRQYDFYDTSGVVAPGMASPPFSNLDQRIARAQSKGRIITGARAIIKVDGKRVGYCSDLDMEFSFEPVKPITIKGNDG